MLIGLVAEEGEEEEEEERESHSKVGTLLGPTIRKFCKSNLMDSFYLSALRIFKILVNLLLENYFEFQVLWNQQGDGFNCAP